MAISLIEKKADPGVVEAIREVLEMAERGEVADVAIFATVNDVDGLGTFRTSSFSDRWRLLAALEYLRSGVHKA